ncbi:hypothetical protein Nepgr_029405 [Nepenthes gracilis]|uniref:Uncharacterized protein n=1 Tax=Nepenthes gracilis TaxID=150966 RepID=A0AAD3TDX0_NEPGR|nr:hypothetical protein Nepgr_029405 [Nepenthes gracilis]
MKMEIGGCCFARTLTVDSLSLSLYLTNPRGRSCSVISGIALRHIILLVLDETRHFFVEGCDGTAVQNIVHCL